MPLSSSDYSTTDMVIDATLRLLPSSPLFFLSISATAGLLALILALRNLILARKAENARKFDMVVLRERERMLRLALRDAESAQLELEPVTVANGSITDFRIVECNESALGLFRTCTFDLRGMMASDLTGMSSENDTFIELAESLESGKPFRRDIRCNPRLMTTSWLHMQVIPIAGRLSVAVSDIRERQREISRLRRASMTDELTGLVNRRGFLALAEERLNASRRIGINSVVLYLDCDSFKQINDLFGHQAGDRTLREISRILKSSVRKSDLVGRMGGDEFVILAEDAVGDCADTIRERVREKLASFDKGFLLPQTTGITIGHAYAKVEEMKRIEDLLHLADTDLISRKHISRSADEAAKQVLRTSSSPKPRSSTNRERKVEEGAASAA